MELGIGVGEVVGLVPEVALGVVVGLRSWTVVLFGLKAGFEVVVEAAVSAGSELVVCLLSGTGVCVSVGLVDGLWADEFAAADA